MNRHIRTIKWYQVNDQNVKDIVDKIPDQMCVWFDYDCRDCHRQSLKYEEREGWLGNVRHNCVGEFGHDLMTTKVVEHYYLKRKIKGYRHATMCHGMSCGGTCIFLNAIGIDEKSKQKHTSIELSLWRGWWRDFVSYYHILAWSNNL